MIYWSSKLSKRGKSGLNLSWNSFLRNFIQMESEQINANTSSGSQISQPLSHSHHIYTIYKANGNMRLTLKPRGSINGSINFYSMN